MSETRIIRLESAGPALEGMTNLELSKNDFQSELPEQKWHIYYEDAAIGITVGVWTTTSMQEVFGPYPGDEFMHILEGRVALLDDENNEIIVNQGETFIVRNGVPTSWKQEGFCRKFFLIYLPPNTPAPAIGSFEDGIRVLRESELATQFISSTNSAGVHQRDAEAFENDAGNLTAGMWETEALSTAMEPFPYHEFAQTLEGSVTITEENGTIHDFLAGDCFFIPSGTICSWKSDEPFRKFYCTLSPHDVA